MSTAYTEILDAAAALPDEERARLVDALIGTLTPPASEEINEAWMEIIDRRWQEFESGEVKLSTWEVVKARASKRSHPHA
ncbi:MAG: addiction module protein [Planctomycetaceae bacterium]|nr:addiction module protein [Planctomycetaceae bacterium]